MDWQDSGGLGLMVRDFVSRVSQESAENREGLARLQENVRALEDRVAELEGDSRGVLDMVRSVSSEVDAFARKMENSEKWQEKRVEQMAASSRWWRETGGGVVRKVFEWAIVAFLGFLGWAVAEWVRKTSG